MPEKPPESDKQRNRQATARKLREAATLVFAARGYDAATTREVAEAAGVNEQLIQRYFGGKAGLLRAIMQNYAERDREGLFGQSPPGDTVEKEIANLLSFHIEREQKYGNFARVAIYRSIVDPTIAAEFARMFTDSREPLILERLTRLRARKLIGSRADLPATAHLLSTLSFALAFGDQLVFQRSAASLRKAVQAAASIFATGLMNS
jgi:AcrR family transcriptional regulator